ncbi:MAG: hypothetical protein RLZZ618_3197 [Pseudomonadota bacterium]
MAVAWPDTTFDEAATLAQAIACVKAAEPDAIVLDMALPDATGSDGVSALLKLAPRAPILVLSPGDEAACAHRLLQMTGAGHMPPLPSTHELVGTLQRLLEARGSEQLAEAAPIPPVGRADRTRPHEALSPQEYRVMMAIVAGQAPAETAAAMGLSVKTVGTYRARVFAKMGLKRNVDLARYCIQHQLE